MSGSKSLLDLTIEELTERARKLEPSFAPMVPSQEKLMVYLDLLNRKRQDESAATQEELTKQNLKIARITLYAAINNYCCVAHPDLHFFLSHPLS